MKATYDVVIPVHKKDLAVLEYCIEAAKKKLVGARRIITISKERYTENAEWFPESEFPFSLDLVREYVGGSAGWYFQQLLKMYAPLVIPNVAEDVMILDSDTVFFRKTKMFDAKNHPLYNISKDTKICRKSFDIAVSDHIDKLWPAISRKNLPAEFQHVSGIAHNMMFNRKIMEELFAKVEEYDGSGDKFFKIFLKHSTNEHSASEYQIYFNFLMIFHRDKIGIRKLRYKNTADLDIRKYRRRFKYDYCSFHSYLRGKKGHGWREKCEDFFKKIYKKLFLIELWNIGIANCEIAKFLTLPNQKIHWLKGVKLDEFRADPFGFVDKNGKKFIFFEKYERVKRKGKISVVEIDNELCIKHDKDSLNEEFHLSYPYIFSHQKKNYVLVESHRANELAIYELLSNLKLEKRKVIFSNLAVVDPSIIFYNNKFWLFFSLADHGDAKLYLAHADDLFGNWQMHKNNPVKEDIKSARSAGQIFVHEGNLYRPSQNCARSYGASIQINKIVKLTEEEFAENYEIEVTPNQLGQYPLGLHNISSLGKNLTLIDGKRNVFTPHKPLIYLVLALNKLILKLNKIS